MRRYADSVTPARFLRGGTSARVGTTVRPKPKRSPRIHPLDKSLLESSDLFAELWPSLLSLSVLLETSNKKVDRSMMSPALYRMNCTFDSTVEKYLDRSLGIRNN